MNYDDNDDGGIRYYAEVGQLEELEPHCELTHQGMNMPKIGEMIESKYLKQSDVPDDVIVTVAKIGQGNVARDDEQPEMKWMARFKEFAKPMVLNSTNIQLLGNACDSDDTDDWIGKTVILYADPSVSFGGKLTGGLRIKKIKPAAKPAEKKTSFDDMDDDVPF